MFQCTCPYGYKNGVCHHAWAVQVVMSRPHSFPIPLEKRADREDIVEDIPKRKSKKDKHAKHPSKALAIEVEPVQEVWRNISLNPIDLPIELPDPEPSSVYSSGFDEAKRDFYESNGVMVHPQFALYGDSYDDYSKFVKELKKERVSRL